MLLMPKISRVLVAFLLMVLVSCGSAPINQSVNDPAESLNRNVHKINRGLDRVALRPASKVYQVVPKPIRAGVSNFASNLKTPGMIINDLIQFKLKDASSNSARFIVNTTAGLGGLFDPASNLGLPERYSDFGETLHVWGVREGPYVELPLFGPSTLRNTIGRMVDFASNPVRLLSETPEQQVYAGTQTLKAIDQRGRFSELVDSIMYDSEDSYAQARLLYLQQRREFLRKTDNKDNKEYIDPYNDVYDK
jgi:phospholipid-binding lipoprotein MlaA